MILNHIILQVKQPTPDSVSAAKIQAMTDSVRARVDSIANHLTNPDSIANLSPAKVAQNIKDFDWSGVISSLSAQLVSFSLRLLAAIAIFYAGKFIINKIYKLTQAVMLKKDFDQSLTSFLLSFIRISLLFLLIITVIGVLGVETSSFIAIFASAGLAIGMALSGTLQNFAGGVLILLIKPYKVGDYIEFGTFKGYVKEIQIFHTVLTTYNNETIIIPNGGLSTGTINNYSSEEYRRLEWRVAISYGDSVADARNAILGIINDEPRIVKTESDVHEHESDDDETPTATDAEAKAVRRPWWKRLLGIKSESNASAASNSRKHLIIKPKKEYAPYVAVENLADSSVVLVTRAWALTNDYWSVLYAINERIYDQLPDHGIHFPFPQLDVHFKQNND